MRKFPFIKLFPNFHFQLCSITNVPNQHVNHTMLNMYRAFTKPFPLKVIVLTFLPPSPITNKSFNCLVIHFSKRWSIMSYRVQCPWQHFQYSASYELIIIISCCFGVISPTTTLHSICIQFYSISNWCKKTVSYN